MRAARGRWLRARPAAPGAATIADARDRPRTCLARSPIVLAVVKTSHSEHGLRHADYDRYRTFCTKRMRRLRKSVGFMLGTKHKFAKRTLRPADCTDARHLLIPLMNAERAWAYAMHIKRVSPGEARPRHHMIARLVKAARWAGELQALCTQRADQRTQLEAEAYAAWMSANHLIERESWAPALRSIFRARTIYSELSRVTLFPEQQVYREMVEEIEPIQRYCRYQLQTQGGAEAAEAAGGGGAEDEMSITDLLRDDDSSSLAASMLRSKLEPIFAQLQSKQAQSLDTVVFRQQALPVTNEKLRVAILRSQVRARAAARGAGGGFRDAVPCAGCLQGPLLAAALPRSPALPPRPVAVDDKTYRNLVNTELAV